MFRVNDWAATLEKFGWPALVLVILGFFFYTALWPMIKKWIERTEARSDASDKLIREQITHAKDVALRAEQRNEKLVTEFQESVNEFMGALDKFQDANLKTVEELKKLSDHIVDRPQRDRP